MENLSIRHITTELTERPHQVLMLMAKGYSTPAIAEELSISTRTVETHWNIVKETLGISTRREAFEYAHQNGLFAEEDLMIMRDRIKNLEGRLSFAFIIFILIAILAIALFVHLWFLPSPSSVPLRSSDNITANLINIKTIPPKYIVKQQDCANAPYWKIRDEPNLGGGGEVSCVFDFDQAEPEMVIWNELYSSDEAVIQESLPDPWNGIRVSIIDKAAFTPVPSPTIMPTSTQVITPTSTITIPLNAEIYIIRIKNPQGEIIEIKLRAVEISIETEQ